MESSVHNHGRGNTSTPLTQSFSDSLKNLLSTLYLGSETEKYEGLEVRNRGKIGFKSNKPSFTFPQGPSS